ncbi:MAG TPA: rhodanese-like domain-containing protein [Pseudolysinimonas sp.]|nr:rhodanese-like domain-containing protein [Pseudolysinimonas sp.]
MKSVTPQEFAALEGAALIDVREPDEVRAVRTEQGQPMPMSTLQDHLDELPEGPLYVICHSGGRSARVTAFLEQQGYDVTNVTGGIQEWEAAGLPVVRG